MFPDGLPRPQQGRNFRFHGGVRTGHDLPDAHKSVSLNPQACSRIANANAGRNVWEMKIQGYLQPERFVPARAYAAGLHVAEGFFHHVPKPMVLRVVIKGSVPKEPNLKLWHFKRQLKRFDLSVPLRTRPQVSFGTMDITSE